ncbi:MAG TPA: baseplate J/gp47 family protein [Gemmatimonadaceae bacterium]|nr:baseplate J/gp47 family protein [Gemmatimonadaceae bacterium]
MSVFPRSTDFTDRDFDALRLRMRSIIRSTFPQWNDEGATNLGNIILDAFAFVGDVLTFGQDANALESRITTVTQRRHLLSLLKMLAYRPPGATAATTQETLTGVGLVADVPIPAGTVIKTQSENPVEFQTLAAVTLTVAQPTAIVTVEHSKTFDENFTASGQANQKITSGQIPYLDGTSTITDGSGLWTQVDNFLDSGSADRHFTLESDNNDRAVVTFGDGVNGQLPTGTINWVYRTGGGLLGNVEAGSINKIESTLVDVLSNTVTVTATNVEAADGGAERESSAVTKIKAPASIRAPRTTVAREDYEIHAVEVPGVARALMLTTAEDRSIELNTGRLYAVPADGGFGNSVLRQKIKDRCTKTFPNSALFALQKSAGVAGVCEPIYVDLQITARVAFARGVDTLAKKAMVVELVRTAARRFLSPTNPAIGFGWDLCRTEDVNLPDGTRETRLIFSNGGEPDASLPLSDLMDVVHDVPGIRAIGPLSSDFVVTATRRFSTTPAGDVIVLAAEHRDVPLRLADFPRLDATNGVTIIDAVTGLVVP